MLSNTTGAENCAFGSFTMGANTTGSFNTAYGMDALRNCTTGNNNTALGHDAKVQKCDVLRIVETLPRTSTHAFTAGGGREQTFPKVSGFGKEMVRNLDKVKAKARNQYLADRRSFVKEGCAS